MKLVLPDPMQTKFAFWPENADSYEMRITAAKSTDFEGNNGILPRRTQINADFVRNNGNSLILLVFGL